MNADQSQIGSSRAWLIWSLTAIAFCYAFFQRVAPSVLVSDLMADFSIGAAVLGTLSALYFYPYVLMQVPLGAMLERSGTRIMLTAALGIAGVGSILFAVAETITIAYMGRLLIGIGSAVGFLASLSIAAKWFPPHRFAFLSGLVMFFGMGGAILAQGPLAGLLQFYDWRSTMWGLGAVGFLLAILVLFLVRNEPPELENSAVKRQSWSEVWRGLAKALSSLEVWKVAIVASTMSGPMLALGGLWGTPYLQTVYGLEKTYAASLVSLAFVGWALGAPFLGWFSDRIGKRKLIIAIGSFGLCLVTGTICFIPDMPLSITVIFLGAVGTFGSAMALTFALIRETAPKGVGSSATGIVNSLTVASGAVLQPGVGYILDQVWSGRIVDGARIYSADEYQTGFILVFASSLIGFLVCLTIKESGKPDHSK